MKKVLQLTTVFLLLFACFSTADAQDLDELGLMAMVDAELYEKHNTEYNSRTKSTLSLEERMAKAKAYDLYVTKEFGSYMNPYNGNLYIINNEEKQYNRAQMMKEGSKESVFSIQIDQSIKPINIENYVPGEYTLILSNDDGDIHVENFIII